MTPDRREIERRVVQVVAEALDVRGADVALHSSLIDDLGAESIDFLDVVFRLEGAFGLKIREDEIWAGSIEQGGQEALDRSLARLRERMPAFRWDRMPARITRGDLSRLITVQTIVDYLEQRLGPSPGAGAEPA
jgi:acyl carrier protein